jgi:hypothetical protein
MATTRKLCGVEAPKDPGFFCGMGPDHDEDEHLAVRPTHLVHQTPLGKYDILGANIYLRWPVTQPVERTSGAPPYQPKARRR